MQNFQQPAVKCYENVANKVVRTAGSHLLLYFENTMFLFCICPLHFTSLLKLASDFLASTLTVRGYKGKSRSHCDGSYKKKKILWTNKV